MNPNVILVCYPKGTTKESLMSIINQLFNKCPSATESETENVVSAITVEGHELNIVPGIDLQYQSPIANLAKNLIKKFGDPSSIGPGKWMNKFLKAYYDPEDTEVNPEITKIIKELSMYNRTIFNKYGLEFLYDLVTDNDL